MIRQNYKGDFSIIERFYAGEDKTPVKVPQHLRIDYFTRNPKGKYTVVRNGHDCTGCAVSDDGMSLTCYLALSRKCIGIGELLKVATEIQDDGNFPDGKKFLPVPQTTDIMLVEGQSDGGKEISSEVMIEMRYGYSAYELAVLNGFKGTEEEWLQSLKQPAEDAAAETAAATKKAIAATEEMEQLYDVALAAESERQTAEQDREQAESGRETEFARLKEESEAATRAANEAGENANAAAEGIDNKISGKQDRTDQSLKTTDKTVAGAINEVYDSLGDINTILDEINGEDAI